MAEIISLQEFKEQRALASLDQLKQLFREEVIPGSVVHLSLDGNIYWDTQRGQIVDKPDFPNHWPLEDFVGWLLPTWSPEIGPKLSPFSIYLSNGDRHTGLGYEFLWNNVRAYVIHHKRRYLLDESEDSE